MSATETLDSPTARSLVWCHCKIHGTCPECRTALLIDGDRWVCPLGHFAIPADHIEAMERRPRRVRGDDAPVDNAAVGYQPVVD